MSKLSICAMIICQSISLAIADDATAQRKKLSEIDINVTLPQSTSLTDLIAAIENEGVFTFVYAKNKIGKKRINLDHSYDNMMDLMNELSIQARVNIKRVNETIVLRGIDEDVAVPVVEDRVFQEIAVSGKVTDENGEPLPGATVLEKGSTNGTTTDLDGLFKLSCPPDAVLTISFVGYKTQEISVNNRSVVDYQMELDAGQLEEVVVVGYGTQKKINLTGAVDFINIDEEIGNRPVASLPQMLQGFLPNLNISTNNDGGEPGSSRGLNIRGTGTLTGNGGEPYILLDGMPISTSQLNSINPNDVESVSMLKDAASAALYGSRGAYGVILITTKKGTASEKGINVEYASSMAFSSPTLLPKMGSSLDYANTYNLASANSGTSPVFSDDVIQDIIDYQNGLIPNEAGVDGSGLWRSYATGYANNDWFDIMYKDRAPQYQHRLSLNGGSEKTTFFLSGNYFKQLGILEFANEKYNRFNFTANLKNQATKWLSFDISSKFSRENKLFPSGGRDAFDKNIIYENIARSWPTNPLFDPNGNIIDGTVNRLRASGNTTNIINNSFIQLGTEVEPVKGWVTRFSYNWNITNSQEEEQRLEGLIQNPDGTTFQAGYNITGVARTFGNSTNQLINAISRYDKSISGHNFGGLIGYERRLQESQSLYGRRDVFITSSLPTISTAVGENYLDDALNQFSTQGVFGGVNYNFQEKYLVEFNARYDGSSFFREGKRWGFFPSVSAGYNIARESFWQPIENVVGSFKLRGSWGQLGNHDPSLANLFLERLGTGVSTYLIDGSRPLIVNTPGLISPNLTWETVTTLDIGLDAALFENHLEVIFDWYNRTTSDMIGPSEALPLLLGTSAPRENNAELETKGWELILKYRNKIGEVGYNIIANLGDNRSTITKYNNPTNIFSTWRVGQDLNELWGYETVGFFESDVAAQEAPGQTQIHSRWGAGDIQYADLDGDGEITRGENTSDDPGDRKIIGNSNPRYSYGLTMGANWKGFDLSVLFQGVAKRDIMFGQNSGMYWGLIGQQWHATITDPTLDYWTQENTDAYFPKPYLDTEHLKNTQSQTKYLQDASYMRLKNIQLSYTVPSSLLQQIGLSKLQVYFSGENLITFTKLQKTFDPEALGGGRGQGRIYPLQKVLSAGLVIGL